MSPPQVVHLTTVHRLRDPRIFYKQVHSLRAAGFDVYLIAQHDRSESVDGVPVVALTIQSGPAARLRRLRQAYRAARNLNAALYHIHDPELIPVAHALKRATGATIVYDRHEDYSARRGPAGVALRKLERWCFAWVDHVVLVNASHIAHLPPGVSHTLIRNYYRPHAAPPHAPRQLSDPPHLLYTGVVSRLRGLSTMLDVAQALPLMPLTLAGVCYVPDDLSYAQRRLRVKPLDHVRWVGDGAFVDWPDLEPLYADASVGLCLMQPHPNYVASIPTKFYEYLHFALPIICSDFPRWRGFVEKHDCGAVVPPGDAAAVARVVQHWQRHPQVYARLSANAASAAPHYRWNVMGKRLVQRYHQLLSSATQGPLKRT